MNKRLTQEEKDLIGELGNITFGTASTALSLNLNHSVDISAPSVTCLSRDEFISKLPNQMILIDVKYTKGIEGNNILLLKDSDALIIADLMMGGSGSDEGEISEFHLSAVQEVMNQMMGNSSTSLSSFLNQEIDISPPVIETISKTNLERLTQVFTDEELIVVSFALKIGNLINSEIMHITNFDFVDEMSKKFLI